MAGIKIHSPPHPGNKADWLPTLCYAYKSDDAIIIMMAAAVVVLGMQKNEHVICLIR